MTHVALSGWSKAGAIALAALSLCACAVAFEWHHDIGWMDPITGLTRHVVRWFGVTTTDIIERSAIENWLVRREGGYVNQWSFVHDTTNLGFGCGLTPEISPLCAGSWNDDFVSCATDEELAEFVRVMRNGAETEKRQAVERACEKLLALYERRR